MRELNFAELSINCGQFSFSVPRTGNFSKIFQLSFGCLSANEREGSQRAAKAKLEAKLESSLIKRDHAPSFFFFFFEEILFSPPETCLIYFNF